MSRQAKRAQDRELKKDIKAVGSLTPRQEQMMERKAINISNRYIEEYGMLIDRSLTAALVDYGIMYGDIEIINRNMSELLLEDSKKTHILEGENLDMVAIQKEVQEAIEKLLEDGTEKKKTINILIYKFPKLSKSMLLTAYGKIRRDLGLTENRLSPKLVNDEFKLKSEKLNGKEMVEHIMDKFDFTKSTAETYYYKWKREFMADKESTVAKGPSLEQIPVVIKTPTPKETEKILETLIEEKKIKPVNIVIATTPIKKQVEEVGMKGLKVLEEKITKTIKVEGENGVYKADTNEGVVLSKNDMVISFGNAKELEEFYNEFKSVFALVV